MKHLFLINPAAGKRDNSHLYREKITAHCGRVLGMQEHRDYAIRVSEKPGDITAWTREAARTGQALRIYACGGDGTLNEVVNGAVGYSNVAVTHFPGGSGNDFIKIFGHTAPFFDLVSLMDDPAETEFDLICCNGDYALNVCSLGFDARIGTEASRYKRLPLITGPGAYLLSALVNTVKGVHRPYRVLLDGEVLEGDLTMILASNGRWYGGSFHPVPDADPCDGLLDVLLVQPVSRLQVAAIIGKYKNGKYADYPELIRHVRTDHLEIRCPAPAEINLDGELRLAKTVRIQVAGERLRFFYPKALARTFAPQIPVHA